MVVVSQSLYVRKNPGKGVDEMKFAAQEGLVPGLTFADQLKLLDKLGYQGVELSGVRLAERVPEIRAALKNSEVSATCVCGGFKFGLLFPKKEDREEAIMQIQGLLSAAAQVGALGVIVVPIFGPPQLPDMAPWKTARELEEELLVEQLSRLASFAGQCGTKVILEPLNRYETHLLNRVEQAVSIAKRVASPHMTVLADVFHMNIEEHDLAAAIRAGGSAVGYVHLADSNRVVPGQGHTDFKSVFAALRDISYTGWMSLECAAPKGEQSLQETITFMKEQL